MQGHSVTTTRDLSRLRDAAARGLSQTEIAREMLTTDRVIQYWAAREKLNLWKTSLLHNPPWIDDARTLAEWGYSKAEARRRIGVDRDKFAYWVAKVGLKFRDGRYVAHASARSLSWLPIGS